MKTDDFIAMLATGVEPVEKNAVPLRFQWALLGGILGAVLILLTGYGLRHDLAAAALLPMFWVKMVVPLSLAILALILATRLGRPGVPTGHLWLALPLPWLLLTGLGLIVLGSAPPQDRLALVLGRTWGTCAFNIALVSVPSFVGLFWAMRGLAPTRPAHAGAAAGLAAAALGTMVYALHCPEMEAPFVAVWYVVGLSIPTVAGAILGPRVLRW